LQSISGVSAINPSVAIYDIHGGKREALFFYLLFIIIIYYLIKRNLCQSANVNLKPRKRCVF
jgi:hypothetical protein